MKSLIIVTFLTLSNISLANGPERKVAQEAQVLLIDVVHRMVPAGDAEKIMFRGHAGIYYLKADSKNYSVIKKALEESIKSEKEVKVKADPNTMEIEELVLETK